MKSPFWKFWIQIELAANNYTSRCIKMITITSRSLLRSKITQLLYLSLYTITYYRKLVQPLANTRDMKRLVTWHFLICGCFKSIIIILVEYMQSIKLNYYLPGQLYWICGSWQFSSSPANVLTDNASFNKRSFFSIRLHRENMQLLRIKYFPVRKS